MKKLIVILILLFAGTAQSQWTDIVDSLKAGRTSVRLKISGNLYNSVVFEQITSGDSVQICTMTDSLGKYHSRDTIKAYLRNVSTLAEISGGLVTGMVSATTFGRPEFSIVNPIIQYIYLKLMDNSDSKPTVYFRIRRSNFR